MSMVYITRKRGEREKKKIKVEGVVFLLMTLLLLTDCHFLSMNGAGTLRQVFSLFLLHHRCLWETGLEGGVGSILDPTYFSISFSGICCCVLNVGRRCVIYFLKIF